MSNSSKEKGNYSRAEAQGTQAFWIGAAGIFITFILVAILLLAGLAL